MLLVCCSLFFIALQAPLMKLHILSTNYPLKVIQYHSCSFSDLLFSPSFRLCSEYIFWKMNTNQAHIHKTAPDFQSQNGTPIRITRRIAAKILLLV